MPNWCEMDIVFEGKISELKTLYEIIENAHIKKDKPYAAYWLGNVLIDAGLSDRINEPNPIACRGSIDDLEYAYFTQESNPNKISSFSLYVETAWTPMAAMWVEILKKLNLNSISFCYKAIECGCGIYQIYDPAGLGYFDNDLHSYYMSINLDNYTKQSPEILKFIKTIAESVFDVEYQYMEFDWPVECLVRDLAAIYGDTAYGFSININNLNDILKAISKEIETVDENSYFYYHPYTLVQDIYD